MTPRVRWVTVGPFQENCYVVADDDGRAVVVDPGDEPARVSAMVRGAGVTIEAIWLTHAHIDHVGALAAAKREWDVPVYMHPADQPLFEAGPRQAAYYGLPFEMPSRPERALADGDELRVGALSFTVLHTPGHAPGHCVFHGDGILIGGDLLFAGSIGRTDLPLADPAAMQASLARVAALPRETVVHPGHGPATTVGAEVADNPFLNGAVRIAGAARA